MPLQWAQKGRKLFTNLHVSSIDSMATATGALHGNKDDKSAFGLTMSVQQAYTGLYPHHPKNFEFPKQTFGKAKPVLCSPQSQWFNSWPFLHYDKGQDVVFCHTCVTAFNLDRIKSSNNTASVFVKLKLVIFVATNLYFRQVSDCS